MKRQSLTNKAQSIIEEVVSPGDLVIDATLGNGYDTLFLARLVGPRGKVYGFDIQPVAHKETSHRLQQAGLTHRTRLFHQGHEAMAQCLPPALHEHIRAIMFNLGYLPGMDKAITTHPETTIEALESCKSLLMPGGRITIVAYTGHPGGKNETDAVEQWKASLDPNEWHFNSIRPDSLHSSPPRLYWCEKRFA
jgi:predicted methyltransferase